MIFEDFDKLLAFPFRALEGSGVCGRRVRRVVESRIKGFAVKDRHGMVSLFVAVQLFVAQKCSTCSCCLGRPDMFGCWSRRKLLIYIYKSILLAVYSNMLRPCKNIILYISPHISDCPSGQDGALRRPMLVGSAVLKEGWRFRVPA